MSSVSWSKRYSLSIREKSSPEVRILGIDPGSIRCGYGVIALGGRDPLHLSSGVISPPPSKPLAERLRQVYDGLLGVMREYRPDAAVIEKIFYAKNVRSAMSLGYARGVALLAAATGGIEIHECSALEVKKAVVGYGRAEKDQVQKMVRLILNIHAPLTADSADALALALCHANTLKFKESVQGIRR